MTGGLKKGVNVAAHTRHIFVGSAPLPGRLSYQFLSACFRNLTNEINSTYYQAFTMRNAWESVVSEVSKHFKVAHSSLRAIMCNPMQPDRFLNRILIGYFFFLRVNARPKYYPIKTILREEFGIVSKFNFPQDGKR